MNDSVLVIAQSIMLYLIVGSATNAISSDFGEYKHFKQVRILILWPLWWLLGILKLLFYQKEVQLVEEQKYKEFKPIEYAKLGTGE